MAAFAIGVEHVPAQELGGRELALELRQLVEVLVFQRFQRFAEHVERGADVDHDVLLGQLLAEERDVDDERRAVHALRRPEERIGQAVADHDAITDFDGEHGGGLLQAAVLGRRAPFRDKSGSRQGCVCGPGQGMIGQRPVERDEPHALDAGLRQEQSVERVAGQWGRHSLGEDVAGLDGQNVDIVRAAGR